MTKPKKKTPAERGRDLREAFIEYLKVQEYPEKWLRTQSTIYLGSLYKRIERAYKEL